MPSLKSKLALPFVLIGAVLIAAACGDPTATATYDPEASVHPSDWLPAGHMTAARQNSNTCKQCHGEDLVSGGISGVRCNSCHLGGPLERPSSELRWSPVAAGRSRQICSSERDRILQKCLVSRQYSSRCSPERLQL